MILTVSMALPSPIATAPSNSSVLLLRLLCTCNAQLRPRTSLFNVVATVSSGSDLPFISFPDCASTTVENYKLAVQLVWKVI